jgi:hypothetical protein
MALLNTLFLEKVLVIPYSSHMLFCLVATLPLFQGCGGRPEDFTDLDQPHIETIKL